MSRIFKVNRMWAALAVAIGVALVVTTAASADSALRFSGAAQVTSLSPGATYSRFQYDGNGNITSVSIRTFGEKVNTGALTVTCDPAGGAACDALNGSGLSDVHVSDEVLSGVTYIPVIDPLLPVDGISGALTGKLAGKLTVTKPGSEGKITGVLGMEIAGTALLVCFSGATFTPTLIAACEDKDGVTGPDGGGFLLPVHFGVHDQGLFGLGPGTGIYAGIAGAKGSVTADIGTPAPFQPATGIVTISDATLITW